MEVAWEGEDPIELLHGSDEKENSAASARLADFVVTDFEGVSNRFKKAAESSGSGKSSRSKGWAMKEPSTEEKVAVSGRGLEKGSEDMFQAASSPN